MNSDNNAAVIKDKMKAGICRKYGPPEVVKIEERLKPIPKADEVLIRVHATTVASGDCRVRSANIPALYRPMMILMYGVGKPRQPIFGTELSGQVEAVGNNVTVYKVGNNVFAMTGMKMGAHAEYITLSEAGMIVPKPNNISY
ncbi:MAG: alcohol dehydrogenase catalytic domain-containing protein [Peptococcaceae bacterium]|nr:alcohol dehydrogenase catalytic domain-containing protein [Peptococcaceae bacterium]